MPDVWRRGPAVNWAQRLRRDLVAVTAAGLLLVGAGCSAGQSGGGPTPVPTVPSSSTAPSIPAPSIPTDGVTLADLGVQHGPVVALSLPRSARISTRVDQPNAVTLVLSAPTAETVAGYLVDALPAGGFTLGEQSGTGATRTLTFAGHGWEGSFTGSGAQSALTLHPS